MTAILRRLVAFRIPCEDVLTAFSHLAHDSMRNVYVSTGPAGKFTALSRHYRYNPSR